MMMPTHAQFTAASTKLYENLISLYPRAEAKERDSMLFFFTDSQWASGSALTVQGMSLDILQKEEAKGMGHPELLSVMAKSIRANKNIVGVLISLAASGGCIPIKNREEAEEFVKKLERGDMTPEILDRIEKHDVVLFHILSRWGDKITRFHKVAYVDNDKSCPYLAKNELTEAISDEAMDHGVAGDVLNMFKGEPILVDSEDVPPKRRYERHNPEK